MKDWRYIVRVCNIDVSAAQADPTNIDGSGNSLYDYMRKAYWRLQNRRIPMGGQICIYMNTDMLELLDELGTNGGGSDNFVRLRRQEVQGEEVLSYRGFPIREADALVNDEDLVA